jgi:thiamine-monophosphate kinase
MEIGEFELIARLVERLPAPGSRVRIGSGDDAAVVDPRGPMVISVDALIEGVHFTLPAFTLRAVGRKALAAALSDLAAMAAEAGEAYVVLGVRDGLAESDLIELVDGVAEVARREAVAVIGGDVNAAPALLISVTAIGYEPEGAGVVGRAGARPGDVVAVTGELGGAAAALALLAHAGAGASLPDAARDRILARQLDPSPRLAAGRALATAGATAMIDISDGLGGDAGHLAAAGGVRLEIDLDRVPLAEGLAAIAGGPYEARLLAASGGEDYELLACLPPDRLPEARSAVEATGTGLTEIGQVTEGAGASLRDPDRGEVAPAGFDHLRDRGR